MATVLIIDDDPTTLGLLQTRLEKTGYQVKTAQDGQEGLVLAEKHRPDLIFLDVRMPKVDGWQVCRALKSNPLTLQAPIIMLTGCSQDLQELYGLQCGADEYITKPWDAQNLLKITARLLARSAAARDARSEASQERVKQFVQRAVRMVGNLPKRAPVDGMAGSILQTATTLLMSYQAGVANDALPWTSVSKSIDELLYWLGLLRDSKTSQDPDIPMLLAEGSVLREAFAAGQPKTGKE